MIEEIARQLERLPHRLSEHVYLSMTALAVGLLISVPLSILLVRRARLRGPALAAVGVIQTVPSLALLALMVPLIAGLGALLEATVGVRNLSGFGFWPALVALVLYSMLPIVRNTVTGILGVDANLIEAARGMGMTERQILLRVQIPLALPIIIAGVRTATIWVVGIATLSTPVGQTSLGDYIFGGLSTRNWTAVLVGCIAAALIAIGLDMLIAMLESAASKRNRRHAIIALIGLAAVASIGVGPQIARIARGDERPAIVGSKDFTEQFILAEMLTRRLNDAGIPSSHRQGLGSTIAFDALRVGDLDLYIDYSGTIWTTVMRRDDVAGSEDVLASVTSFLRQEHGIICLGALGFENTYALVMRRERADELGIRTIDDLVRHAPHLSIGGSFEFFERPEWERLRDVYGLSFARNIGFDSTLMYEAVARDEVEVISAFSTDGRIAAYDLIVLDDPRRAMPPYEAILLLSADAARREDIVAALRPLIGAVDDVMMREANRMVDVDRRSIESAAEFLSATLIAGDDRRETEDGQSQ